MSGPGPAGLLSMEEGSDPERAGKLRIEMLLVSSEGGGADTLPMAWA
jgi:hypothetical protein